MDVHEAQAVDGDVSVHDANTVNVADDSMEIRATYKCQYDCDMNFEM